MGVVVAGRLRRSPGGGDARALTSSHILRTRNGARKYWVGKAYNCYSELTSVWNLHRTHSEVSPRTCTMDVDISRGVCGGVHSVWCAGMERIQADADKRREYASDGTNHERERYERRDADRNREREREQMVIHAQ